jgi:molybdopterin-guanine dinucleotide biosynthesis protein A
MEQNETKKEVVGVYVDKSTADDLRSWAESEKRSLSNLLGKIIDEAIAARTASQS